MRILIAVFLACFCLTAPQPTFGGDKKKDLLSAMPKPGPEHKLLARLAGTYDAQVKSWFGPGQPKESKGTLVRKMILDGRYLHESFQGDFLGMPFQGMGVIGFDVNKKKYVMGWIDNFGTGISLAQGTYNQKTKTWTFAGEEDSPALGGKVKMRDVLTVVSDDEQRFTMYRTPAKTGGEKKVMEVTYTRKKAEK